MIRKIVHCSVILLTFVALVGVNVKQLYCNHTHADHLEIWGVVTDACPCSDGCCDHCHRDVRHHFLKLTEISQIESQLELEQVFFYLVDFSPLTLLFPVAIEDVYTLYEGELPDVPIVREMLCTYLC